MDTVVMIVIVICGVIIVATTLVLIYKNKMKKQIPSFYMKHAQQFLNTHVRKHTLKHSQVSPSELIPSASSVPTTTTTFEKTKWFFIPQGQSLSSINASMLCNLHRKGNNEFVMKPTGNELQQPQQQQRYSSYRILYGKWLFDRCILFVETKKDEHRVEYFYFLLCYHISHGMFVGHQFSFSLDEQTASIQDSSLVHVCYIDYE